MHFGYFTGEWTDPTGLVYLRARYYAPWQGRFLSRDVWEGEAERPVSYNAWAYGYANPVRYSDPSGYLPYNRMAAVLWARQHDREKDLDLTYVSEIDGQTYQLFDYERYVGHQYLCTVFVSYALWEGGVRDTRPDPSGGNIYTPFENYSPAWWSKDAIRTFPGHSDWALNKNYKVNDPDNPWANTNAFYRFMIGGYANVNVSIVLDVPYRIPRYYGYETDLGSMNSAWEGFLALALRYGRIMAGDVVLYDSEGNGNWDHAALVDDWANQTYHTDTQTLYCTYMGPCACGIPKPRVIEKSGLIKYGIGGRSIDNTKNEINRIMVLHLW